MKNAVIREAMNIIDNRIVIEDVSEEVIVDEEPNDTETEPVLTTKEKASLMWKYYSDAKNLLDRDSNNYNPAKAVELLIESAKLGCGVAK